MFCFSDTEYKKSNDLKRFVIEPALKEIHEQTDLSITDTQILKKRALNSLGLHHSQAENSIKNGKKQRFWRF